MGKRERGWMNLGKGYWEGEGLKIIREMFSLTRGFEDI